jgi:tRNA/rRNA methyltransferase
MLTQINLNNIAVVLHRPRIPENIGSAARAMMNMGVRRLIVVDPQNCELDRVCKLATHAALDVVEQMEVVPDLKAALGDFRYVVGTTARLGGQRRTISTPAKLAEKLVSISEQNRIAILFGPEDRGLTNEDIRNCDFLVNIPTADFSSLNLAQAVMITCYELFRYTSEKPKKSLPRLANRFELEAMYEVLTGVLIRISFINPQNPDYFMNNLRQFFARLPLRAKEVQIIRGICRQVDWYGKKCFQEGLDKRDSVSGR